MPQFYTGPLSLPQRTNTQPGESPTDISSRPSPLIAHPLEDISSWQSPLITRPLQDISSADFSVLTPESQSGISQIPQMRANQLTSLTGPLADVVTTQTFIAALQVAMATASASRQATVIIPGTKKRRSTQALVTPSRHMHPSLRLGIMLGTLVPILIISLLTLSSPGQGKHGTGIPVIGGIINWVHAQQQSLLLADGPINTTKANTTHATNLPPLELSTSQYVAVARQDASNAGINSDYFVRQIQQESGFDPNAVSPAGAIGIAQFEPATAAGLGFDPHDPIASLSAAAKYMASMAGQYGGDYAKALAAYNGGPGAVTDAVNAGGSNWLNFLVPETRHYIYIIMGI